jgi:hypothetical protein
MLKLAIGALAALLAVSPAAAKSLSPAQVGTIFCYSRLSGDMAPVLAILTDDLRTLVEAAATKTGSDSIAWQGKAGAVDNCQPVGATGTAEAPQVVLSYGFRDPGQAGFSDSIVMHFVDERLRIDDIKFAGGSTLRAQLQAP